MKTGDFIDVWNVDTFDDALLLQLRPWADLITAYFNTDRSIFRERISSDRWTPMPDNSYARDFNAFVDVLDKTMEERAVRGWHYTRLLDEEVARIRREGIHLSSAETLQYRLNQLVAMGQLSPDIASKIYQASPLQRGQSDIRSDRFWMTSHPQPIDDSGVKFLLTYWGGEVANMWLQDQPTLSILSAIGMPRVLEVCVPLRLTRNAHSAAGAVIAAFARSIGVQPEPKAFDICAYQPLDQKYVLNILTAGEPAFEHLVCGYPERYVEFRSDNFDNLEC